MKKNAAIFFLTPALVIGLMMPSLALGQTPAAKAPAKNEGFTMVPAYPNKISPNKFIYEVHPGGKIDDAVAVKNFAEETINFSFYAANATLSNQGSLAYRTRADNGPGPADWFTFETPIVSLSSQESKLVKFTVEIPKDTPLGDYKAGVAMERSKADSNNSSITIATRFILHVQIKVTEQPGEVAKITPNPVVKETGGNDWKAYYFWISLIALIISISVLIWSFLNGRKKQNPGKHRTPRVQRKPKHK